METFLNRLNLVLVVLAGGLVVYQWTGESRADATIVELRTNVRSLEQRSAEQAEALRRSNDDLKDFKSVIGNLKAQTDDDETQIRRDKAEIFVLQQEALRRASEADGLKRSLAAYKEAIGARDSDIRILLDQRRQLVTAATDAAHKAGVAVDMYNGLAGKYEGLVGKYNDLAKRYQAAEAANGQGASKPPADAGS
jgi:chromosome segregation ATPase